jgi:ferritin-like metal-binding protein YciE
MFFSNDKNKLIVYLNEILSIENAVIKRLHRRMQQTSLPNSRNILQDQLQEEKEQQSRLENLIADYWGKSTNAIADLPSLNSLTDAMKKKKGNALNSQDETHDNKNDHMTPQEIEILNTKEDALIKNAEIMVYKNVLKVAEKIADKNVMNILKQNLQEKESTYASITTSESKMLSDMRKNGDPVNESFSLGSAVADMLTSYWNSKENPSKVYIFNRRVHHGAIGSLLGLSTLYKNSPLITGILSGLGSGLQKDDYNDTNEWFLFKKREEDRVDNHLHDSIAREKLQQKIGKALGLEKASQLAIEEITAKGLLNVDGIEDKLEIMKNQAKNHQTNLEELLPDLASEGLSLESIQKTASETKRKAHEIMKTYLGEDPDNCEAIEFLCLSEGEEVIHYELLNTLAKEIENRRFATCIKASLAEEKEHLELCTRLAKEIAASARTN